MQSETVADKTQRYCTHSRPLGSWMPDAGPGI